MTKRSIRLVGLLGWAMLVFLALGVRGVLGQTTAASALDHGSGNLGPARPGEDRMADPGLLPAEMSAQASSPAAPADARLDWWREARFGLFIHRGLYAVPAGEWNGRTDYGEWIRNNGRIPIDTYDQLRTRFNPTKFDADQWVQMAKAAGMKYIVITTKHHDGFGLWDSKETDFDVMATPFRRDILKELADASARHGIRLCFYHSIMDWHHPDYLPRRPWEAADRPVAGADFERYVRYMKAQLKELLTNYGPIGILWFDGQWEGTWANERGQDLYTFVRAQQPAIIVNNRVGRTGGDWGLNREQGLIGDYGTPEQEIPATGIPGLDWETCMTMNRNWGYNRADHDYKSTTDLIRNLVDIASKGGNFLLNVGPTADGDFPPESVERLRGIGNWMRTHGASIYGTHASPFPSLSWGRATARRLDANTTRLYLHVFDAPRDRVLVVPGLLNPVREARLMAKDGSQTLVVDRAGHDLRIALPPMPAGAEPPADVVIELDVVGEPDVTIAPAIEADTPIFVDRQIVRLVSNRKNVDLRFTVDGTEPQATSPHATAPIPITRTTVIRARAFRGAEAVSPTATATFTKVNSRPSDREGTIEPGLVVEVAEGDFRAVPDFGTVAVAKRGVSQGFDLSHRTRDTQFAMRYTGFVTAPVTGVYQWFLRSDDGSRLWVGERLLIDNDGPHSSRELSGYIALEAGRQPVTVVMFEADGGFELEVSWTRPGARKEKVPAAALGHRASRMP